MLMYIACYLQQQLMYIACYLHQHLVINRLIGLSLRLKDNDHSWRVTIPVDCSKPQPVKLDVKRITQTCFESETDLAKSSFSICEQLRLFA